MKWQRCILALTSSVAMLADAATVVVAASVLRGGYCCLFTFAISDPIEWKQ